jgi:peptidoglycan/LPS O-acetylase OafA/YrhL
MQSISKQNNRMLAFDGLRGLSSILIMLNHKHILELGWIGVPIFFVFSGYLITDILKKNINSNNYYSAFYFRRTLRIFPIYYLAFFFCLLYGIVYKMNLNDWWWYIIYQQNHVIGWKFDATDFTRFFNHTWSLGVEEQFYLLWPLLFLYFSRKNKVLWLISIGIIISIVTKLIIIQTKMYDFNYTNTLSNIDMLLFGALIAVYKQEISNKIQTIRIHNLWIAFFGILFLIITEHSILSVFNLDSNYPYGNYEGFLIVYLTILFTCCFIILTIHPDFNLKFKLGRWVLFENPLLVYLGKISYGTYLYHYMIFPFTDNKLTQLSFLLFNQKDFAFMACSQMLISIIVAAISWEFFEKKILKFKDKVAY